jgi:hypothetical protein
VVAAPGAGPASGAAGPRATLRSGSLASTPSSAARTARPRSPAEGNRSSRSFAIARWITASNAGGISGTVSVIRGGGSDTCAHIFDTSLSPG